MTSGWEPPDPWALRVCVPWRGQRLWIACSHRPPAEAEAPLLLCLHGAYCNKGSFSCIFSCAALAHCGVLAVDLPGHGESSKIAAARGPAAGGCGPDAEFPARLEDMADVVLGLLRALGHVVPVPAGAAAKGPPLVMVGHSLGGAVALLLTDCLAKLGARARGLISLEGCLVATDTPENGLASRWMRKSAAESLALDLLEDIAAAAHLGRDPAGLQHWRECAECCGETVHYLAVRMSASLVGWSRSNELPQRLGNLPLFRYIYGAGSGKYTPMLRAALSERGHCRAVGLENSGHFMLLDHPEETMKLVADAVQEVEDLCKAGHFIARGASASKPVGEADEAVPDAKRMRLVAA